MPKRLDYEPHCKALTSSLLSFFARFYHIIAAAAGLDAWTAIDSPGIQLLWRFIDVLSTALPTRLYRIIAAAAGLDAWTAVNSRGIQLLAFLPTSARSAQADFEVTWVPLPVDTQSPYPALPAELQVVSTVVAASVHHRLWCALCRSRSCSGQISSSQHRHLEVLRLVWLCRGVSMLCFCRLPCVSVADHGGLSL